MSECSACGIDFGEAVEALSELVEELIRLGGCDDELLRAALVEPANLRAALEEYRAMRKPRWRRGRRDASRPILRLLRGEGE